jgi:hypothetical protein
MVDNQTIKEGLVLSIEECREKLGDIATGMPDERVAQIRDYLYALCHNVIDQELEKFYDRNKR